MRIPGAHALASLLRRHEPELVAPEDGPAVVEVGSFTHGACEDCDWRGAGRRARSSARTDAELHRLTGCGTGTGGAAARPVADAAHGSASTAEDGVRESAS